jgi:hypothetical protein
LVKPLRGRVNAPCAVKRVKSFLTPDVVLVGANRVRPII